MLITPHILKIEGNVRVVLTEEDATFSRHYLATMEQAYALTEEDNFEGVLETRDDKPYNYPYDGSVDFNIKISELTADGDKKIGPSKVLPARRGGSPCLCLQLLIH